MAEAATKRDAARLGRVAEAPGHVFYDRPQPVLIEVGIAAFVEGLCKPYDAPKGGLLCGLDPATGSAARRSLSSHFINGR